MKVEQENFLRPIFSSVQRLRRWFGTSLVIVWAKSELITSASALYSPATGADADRLAALEQDFLDRFVQADADTHLGRRLRHRRHDGAGAAARMVDAELVFHERQDREQAGAAERRHAQILALEREGEPDPGVGEVARQVGIDGLVRPHQRQRLQQRRIDQIEHAVEGLLQHGPEGLQLPPVVRHEARQVGGVGGRQLRHLLGHPRLIGRGVQFSAGLEDQMVLRVEPDQVALHGTGPCRRRRKYRSARAGTGRRSAPCRSGSRPRPRWSKIVRRPCPAARRRVTSAPVLASSMADARPPGPAPTITIRRLMMRNHGD